VEFSGNNFVFYDNSMAAPISNATIFTATFLVKASAPTDTKIAVSAHNVTLSDGQKDMPVGTVTYSVNIAPPLSDNCRLATLTVGNTAITPGFSPDVLEYSASVPFEIGVLDVSAIAEHSGAKIYIENPALAVAATTAVRITVTAENGKTRTYVIRVSRPQDPNYIPSDNAKLKSLSVDGYTLSPVFSEQQKQYYVWLPYEAETVTVKAMVEDQRAKLTVGEQPELIPGQGNDIPVTVTAENGKVEVYTVTVIRAPKHEDIDRFLNGELNTVPETEPTEEPTAAPATEPETQPATDPLEPMDMPSQEARTLSLPAMIVVFLSCALIGAAVGVTATFAAGKKKE
jgi:hypothetical protein